VVNAEKVNLTGKKWEEKLYIYHTGYPGTQIHQRRKGEEQKPERLITMAVQGCSPKTSWGKND
jgi:large subunit ribosomal protein L13